MECEFDAEDGRDRVEPAVRQIPRVVSQQQQRRSDARVLVAAAGSAAGRRARAGRARRAPAAPPARAVRAVGAASAVAASRRLVRSVRAFPPLRPFMSNMEEISYWIYTKRAPCLMTYDSDKKQTELAQCSKSKPKSVPSVAEVPSPKKKKKRKLSLLDDDSVSVEKQQNVYFDTSQKQKQTVISSCKSDTLGSDIDFNIKNTSVRGKTRRSKLQKSTRTTLHKKNKVVTSTPKTCNLRRSLRQAQQSHHNNSHLNTSFEVYNSIINGNTHKETETDQQSPDKFKKTPELLAGGDQSVENKKNVTADKSDKSKNEVLNGQFEDLSDVSGFTANYIRSTKLQSTKTPRKLRCKNSRNLVKESQQSIQKDNTMVVCVNKSMNTGMPKSAGLNCSTDSENVINLVTKSTDLTAKVSKSTSLLKFLDTRSSKNGNETVADLRFGGSKTRSRGNLNVSFQSQSSTSRYPKRQRNCITPKAVKENPDEINQADKKRKISKNSSDFNNSDRKENPDATTTTVSKTRSGRSIGLTLRQHENTVLVLSNSTDQISSLVSMNVASPSTDQRDKLKKKKRVTRHLRSQRATEKQNSLQKDSLRDKSGFAACFSDSDEDSEPLKQRKFFCA